MKQDLIDACVMECSFREHMSERDLLFHDTVAPHLAAYDPGSNESQQRDYLTHRERMKYEGGMMKWGGFCGAFFDWEGAKTRVLSILKQRAERGESGISNKEIRAITHYDRNQSYRLMKELRTEPPRVESHGHGKGARYVWG